MHNAVRRCGSATPRATRAEVSQKFTGRLPAILPSVRRAGLPEPRPPERRGCPSTSRGFPALRRTTMPACSSRCKLRILVHAVRLYPALRVKPYRDDARNRCSALRDQYRFTRFDSTKIGAHAVLDLGNRRSDHLVFSMTRDGHVSHMKLAEQPWFLRVGKFRQARKHPMNRNDRMLRRRTGWPRNSDHAIEFRTLAEIAVCVHGIVPARAAHVSGGSPGPMRRRTGDVVRGDCPREPDNGGSIR